MIICDGLPPTMPTLFSLGLSFEERAKDETAIIIPGEINSLTLVDKYASSREGLVFLHHNAARFLVVQDVRDGAVKFFEMGDVVVAERNLGGGDQLL